MRFDIMTIFPEMCRTMVDESILGRAQNKGAIKVNVHNIRDFSENKHRKVDDYPYGGGMGMLMAAPPIFACYQAIETELGQKPYVIYMTPKGQVFNQEKAREMLQHPQIALLCGHYEGIDERVLDAIVDEEISIGDFVLTGGELAAAMVVDAVSRMVPGVLSDDSCFENESIYSGILEEPQYTRPPEFLGVSVPEVLLSGHHANIVKWRREQALIKTLHSRPELLKAAQLTENEKEFLKMVKRRQRKASKKNQ